MERVMRQQGNDSFFDRAFRSFMYRLASRIGARAAEELAPRLIEHWPDILQAAGRSASRMSDTRRLRLIFFGDDDRLQDILRSAQDTMTGGQGKNATHADHGRRYILPVPIGVTPGCFAAWDTSTSNRWRREFH